MVFRGSKRHNRFYSLIFAIIALTVLAVFATGQPEGPDTLTNEGSETRTQNGPASTTAQAGNVTELTFVATSVTKGWQGYYGNISGTITLEDSSGNVFYNWTAAEPEGEIYASTNNSITWTSIQCFQFTNPGEPNLTTEEARYGFDAADVDGIDETYNETDHDLFYIGTVNVSGCPTTNPYTQGSGRTDNWQNTLLLDPDTDSLVFTSLIENRDPANDTDLTGFNGNTYDFQMFVAEDEHTTGVAGPTTYFFWVEIE